MCVCRFNLIYKSDLRVNGFLILSSIKKIYNQSLETLYMNEFIPLLKIGSNNVLKSDEASSVMVMKNKISVNLYIIILCNIGI